MSLQQATDRLEEIHTKTGGKSKADRDIGVGERHSYYVLFKATEMPRCQPLASHSKPWQQLPGSVVIN